MNKKVIRKVEDLQESSEETEAMTQHDSKAEKYETLQVTLKVDPSEINKVNVNMSEPIIEPTGTKHINSEAKTGEQKVSQNLSITSSNEKTAATGYEADKTEPLMDQEGEKNKKKNRKKKQKVKPEYVPSAHPNSTEVSDIKDQTDLVSSDGETVMPEEELLPEGREEILSPDESFRSISEIQIDEVKILEESIISSPTEVTIQTISGIIYPGEIIEVTYIGDVEQQTDSVKEFTENKRRFEIDTKEVQAIPETSENETQMSPRVEIYEDIKTDTTETSIQTIIMQFIESESQTSEPMLDDSKKSQKEQEIQTEPLKTHDNKLEAEAQTESIETLEGISQTDILQSTNDGGIISQIIVNEIIEAAIKSAEYPDITTTSCQDKLNDIFDKTEVETQTKSKKKRNKNKDRKIEIELQTTIHVEEPDHSEKSQIAFKEDPDFHKDDDINVHVVIENQETIGIQPDIEGSKEAVFLRLNEIMKEETRHKSTNEIPFTLSQNLNHLINSIDQQRLEAIPWNAVKYMMDAHIENRNINNSTCYSVISCNEPGNNDKEMAESLKKIEQYVNMLPEIIESGDDRVIQKTIIVITKVIVTYLEQTETRITYLKQSKEISSKLQCELYKMENVLLTLRESITSLKNVQLREDIYRCVESLDKLVQLDKEFQHTVHQDIENYYVELTKTDEAIKQLINETILIEEKCQSISQSNAPVDDKLRLFELLESTCKENRKTSSRLIKKNNNNDEHLNIIRSCLDRIKDAEFTSRIERRKLIQLANLSEEYVAVLNEFSQITLVANSLVDKTILTNSLETLQNEIQRHRKFFVNLNHCRNILESLEKNLDSETRLKHSQLHNALHQKATVILEKAGDRAQKLSLAASRWTILEKRMKSEEQWLQVAQQRVPDLSTVTSADYEQYITLYQSLNSDIAAHHAKLLQNFETSIKLQELIYAPNLETKCNDALTKLMSIKDDVNCYLKKLLHFRRTWNDYNLNADRIENWMNHVDNELDHINIPENFIEYPVENMRNFWEIKAQYEFNNQIHGKVCENFDNSLKIISIADDKLQLQFYAQLDERWQNVTNRIDAIKNQITENISSTCPSYKDKLLFLERELDELLHIINNTKGIIRNSEELNLYIERLVVLKSRIVVVENELVTIGFISTNDTETVGELCEKSHKISLHIGEELELADLCRGRLSSLREEISSIRESQINYNESIGEFENATKLESAAIEKALVDCQAMRENLVLNWQDIMRVRHLLHTLPTGLRMSVSPVDVEKQISQLEDDYVDIEKRLCDIENLLKTRFVLWKRFEKQLESIQQSIQETDFMVELLTIHGNIDYDRLLKATERLEVNIFDQYFSNIKMCFIQGTL